ncbi:MAG TPA: hypothetical protein VGA36_06220 [Nitriliruptorales bacterium]
MYRDDPLDDEAELRDLLGDRPVDRLVAAGAQAVAVACDIASILLGWTGPDDVAAWFQRSQQRLDGQTPITALAAGDHDDVEEAARLWVAAQG